MENRLYAVQMEKKNCPKGGRARYYLPFRLTPSSFHAFNHGSQYAVIVSWEVHLFHILELLATRWLYLSSSSSRTNEDDSS